MVGVMPTKSRFAPADPTGQRDWWTLAEWAELYGFSRNGAYAMALRGEIPGAVAFGKRWRISKVAFLRAFHGEHQAAAS